MFARLRPLLLFPVLALLMAAGPELVDPPPIAVPAGLTDAAIEKCIVDGVTRRGWIVNQRKPGYMQATLNVRSHMAQVGISYDQKAIQIRYEDSSNLDYEVSGGVRHIHRNYAKWINNMTRDIAAQLQVAAVAHPGT
jgi:hypothetical protein